MCRISSIFTFINFALLVDAALQLCGVKSIMLVCINSSFTHLRIVSMDASLYGFPCVITNCDIFSNTLVVLRCSYSLRHEITHSSFITYALYCLISLYEHLISLYEHLISLYINILYPYKNILYPYMNILYPYMNILSYPMSSQSVSVLVHCLEQK